MSFIGRIERQKGGFFMRKYVTPVVKVSRPKTLSEALGLFVLAHGVEDRCQFPGCHDKAIGGKDQNWCAIHKAVFGLRRILRRVERYESEKGKLKMGSR